jgi:Tol biopolymer transport system component
MPALLLPALLWAFALPPGSPPAARLIIASERGAGGVLQLYLAAADGSGARRITHGDAVEPEGVFSPDGARIACTVADPVRNTSDIAVMAADGTGLRRLAVASGKEQCCSPTWSPDGRRIAYAVLTRPSRGEAACHVWVVPADGGAATRLGEGMLPAWSPDGRTILCTVVPAGPGERKPAVYRMDADGGHRGLMLPDAAMAAWSPDGRRVAFIGIGERGSMNLFTCAPDGAGRKQLTTLDDPFVCGPQWTQDGRSILFTDAARPKPGTAEPSIHVYSVPAQGGKARQITHEGDMSFVGNGSGIFLLMAVLAGPG